MASAKSLLPAEVGLIKGMLGLTPRPTDQKILAYLGPEQEECEIDGMEGSCSAGARMASVIAVTDFQLTRRLAILSVSAQPANVEDLLAARGITVSHRTVRVWAEKFGRRFANKIRRRSTGMLGNNWHLNEVVISIGGKTTTMHCQHDHQVPICFRKQTLRDAEAQCWTSRKFRVQEAALTGTVSNCSLANSSAFWPLRSWKALIEARTAVQI